MIVEKLYMVWYFGFLCTTIWIAIESFGIIYLKTPVEVFWDKNESRSMISYSEWKDIINEFSMDCIVDPIILISASIFFGLIWPISVVHVAMRFIKGK